VPDSQRDSGLANATSAKDSYQPLRSKQRLDLQNLLVPVNHTSQCSWQVGSPGKCVARFVLFGLAHDWCDKAVTPTLNICDVSWAPLPVAQCFAQGRHMDAQRALLDSDIGPHLRDQFVLTNGLAGPFDESQKKVKGPSAERNGVACLL
jgi:hypothetical protein